MTQKINFKKLSLNRWKLYWFFIKKMPLGFISGMRVVNFNDNYASISLPFNYITKNPFKSVYFAAQSMAAELSSGIIAINEIYKAPVPVSMLVLNMDAQFTKKAKTNLLFTCNDVKTIAHAVKKTIESDKGQTVTITTTGTDKNGEIVSVFHFTWTFKTKKLKNITI